MKLLNYTEYPIVMIKPDGTEIIYNPIPTYIGLSVHYESKYEVEGIPVLKNMVVTQTNLPPETPDTLLIVDEIIAESFPKRKDLVTVDTSIASTVGDAEGRLIGYRRLKSYYEVEENTDNPDEETQHCYIPHAKL
jgi:hypothetical protein